MRLTFLLLGVLLWGKVSSGLGLGIGLRLGLRLRLRLGLGFGFGLGFGLGLRWDPTPDPTQVEYADRLPQLHRHFMPGQLHVPDFVVFLDDDDRPPLLRLLGLELGSDAEPTLPHPYPFT